MSKKENLFWNMIEKALHVFVFKILHLHFLEKRWSEIMQFVKFGIVGLSNTVISYVIYVVALLALQKHRWLPKTDYLVAQLIAFSISVLWSFYWNRKFVFHADNEEIPWPQALLKTYISYAFTGLFLNSILSVLWVQCLHIPKIAAPIFNLLLSVPINFVLNKFWAFRKR